MSTFPNFPVSDREFFLFFLTFPLFPALHMPCDPFPQTGREQTVQTDLAAYPEAVTSLSLWQLALASHRLSPQSTTVH